MTVLENEAYRAGRNPSIISKFMEISYRHWSKWSLFSQLQGRKRWHFKFHKLSFNFSITS